jgi:hypothetical protein
MASVADGLREAQRARMAALTVAERVAIAFELGETDVEMLCAAQHVAAADARHRFTCARRLGRRPSRVMERNQP